MIDQQLLDQIKQEIQQGRDKEEIKKNLLVQGWQESDVEDALTAVSSSEDATVQTEKDASSQASSVSPQQPVKKSGRGLLIAVLVTITLLIGGVVFGYYQLQHSPERIVQKMLAQVAEVESLAYEGEVRAEVDQQGSVSVQFDGVSDLSDLNDQRGALSLRVEADALGFAGESAFDVEMRTIGRVVYMKLNSIPHFGFFDPDLFVDQWILIDTEELLEEFGLNDRAEELPDPQELSPEQVEEIQEAVASAQIFTITEVLPSEKVEGVNTYHYAFVIDREELKKLIIDVNTITQEEALNKEEIASLDRLMEDLEAINGEIWIGKKDLLLRKILVNSRMESSGEFEMVNAFTMSLVFKNYDEPVSVTPPSSARGFHEVLQEFEEVTAESIRKSSWDAVRISDIRWIHLALEMYFDDNGHYPDSLSELLPILSTVPTDPRTEMPYEYQRLGDGEFQVCAELESGEQYCGEE